MIDAAGILGAVMIAGGVGWIYPPAGVIVGGLILLTAAVLASRRAQPKKDDS